MKKILSILLALPLLATLSACSDSSTTSSEEPETTIAETTEETTEAETTIEKKSEEINFLDTTFSTDLIEFKYSSNWEVYEDDNYFFFVTSNGTYMYFFDSASDNVTSDERMQMYYSIALYDETIEDPEIRNIDGVDYPFVIFKRNTYDLVYFLLFADNGVHTFAVPAENRDEAVETMESWHHNGIDLKNTRLNNVSKTTESKITTGQKNALETAKKYIDILDFSYEGLINQLEYEKYTHEEAVYGADNCGADWNAEAANMARKYLDLMPMSRDELIDQLLYEGFTQEQAEYGAQAAGY